MKPACFKQRIDDFAEDEGSLRLNVAREMTVRSSGPSQDWAKLSLAGLLVSPEAMCMHIVDTSAIYHALVQPKRTLF